jgi:hypothetical protein
MKVVAGVAFGLLTVVGGAVVACDRGTVPPALQSSQMVGPAKAPNGQSQEIEAARKLIEDNDKFAVCRTKELDFTRYDGPCDKASLSCENTSGTSSRPVLQMLANLGYIGGEGHPITVHHIPYPSWMYRYYWTPNEKGQRAIGTSIRAEKVHTKSLVYGELILPKGTNPYRWTLILGCRELLQLDATTPLADGLKVDFSWHWKDTDLGTADKLTEKRQRGIAYFTRSNNDLSIDQIHYDSEIEH